MPVYVPLRKIEPPPWRNPPAELPNGRTHRVYTVGTCWYASRRAADGPSGPWFMFPDGPDDLHRHELKIAPEHLAVGVTPIVVVLPDGRHGYPWCVHAPILHEGGWASEGWAVTGSIEGTPTLTVTPSIDVKHGWHGHIRDGYLETPQWVA